MFQKSYKICINKITMLLPFILYFCCNNKWNEVYLSAIVSSLLIQILIQTIVYYEKNIQILDFWQIKTITLCQKFEGILLHGCIQEMHVSRLRTITILIFYFSVHVLYAKKRFEK